MLRLYPHKATIINRETRINNLEATIVNHQTTITNLKPLLLIVMLQLSTIITKKLMGMLLSLKK